MATRPPRLKRPHTYFHVTSRGINKWNLFLDDFDRQRFMHILAAVCKHYGIQAHAYCLMGNHFHLVLYCCDPNLSSAMRDLKSRYAKYFNRLHKGTGAVFEGPFVEVPILDDDHLMFEIRYTHRNPFDLDPNASIANHPWSSHGIYLGLRQQPHFVTTRVGHRLFGPNYRLEIELPRDSDKVQNAVQPSVTSPGEVTLGVVEDWSLASIRGEVAHAGGCEVIDVSPQKRNGLIGVAVVLAMDLGGYTAAEVADPFGYKSAGAVRMAAKRTRARLLEDRALSEVDETARRRLRPAA